MILRIYLFSIYVILFLSIGLLSLILVNVNPYLSPVWMLILFYFTFWLFWTALFSLIGYYLKLWAGNKEVIFAHLIPTLRQSIIISFALVGLLFLYQIKVINWWIALLLILAMFMIELFFRRK